MSSETAMNLSGRRQPLLAFDYCLQRDHEAFIGEGELEAIDDRQCQRQPYAKKRTCAAKRLDLYLTS